MTWLGVIGAALGVLGLLLRHMLKQKTAIEKAKAVNARNRKEMKSFRWKVEEGKLNEARDHMDRLDARFELIDSLLDKKANLKRK